MIAAMLLSAPPAFEGPPHVHGLDMLGCVVEAPADWRVLEEDVESARLRIDELGGEFAISRGRTGKRLAAARRAVIRAARKAGWRTVERRWTKMDGARAAALMFDIDKGGIVSRQLFYFTMWDEELWVLQFGTRRDRFEYDRYRAIAASLSR